MMSSLNDRFDKLSLELGLAQNLALILSSEELHEEHGSGRMSSAVYSLAKDLEKLCKECNRLHRDYLETGK